MGDQASSQLLACNIYIYILGGGGGFVVKISKISSHVTSLKSGPSTI